MTVYRDKKRATYRYHFQLLGTRYTGRGYATRREASSAAEARRLAILNARLEPCPTFAALVQLYLAESVRRKSEKWCDQLQWKLTKGFKQWADLHPREITPSHVQRALSELAAPRLRKSGSETRLSAATVNEYRKIIFSVFAFAEELEIVERNVVRRVKRVPEKYREPDPIPTAELRKLMVAAPPQMRAFLTVLALTGARPGEIQKAMVADVHLEASPPYIALSTNKTRGGHEAVRKQYLPQPAVAAIEQQMARVSVGRLFPAEHGGILTDKARGNQMKWLRKRAGVDKRWSYRNVRQWAATAAVALGMSNKVVAKFLGQRRTEATERYMRVSDELMMRVGDFLVSELERKETEKESAPPVAPRVS